MNGKDDQNFFSTEEEYNKSHSDDASKNETAYILSEEYNKYLDDSDRDDGDSDALTDENEPEDVYSQPQKNEESFLKRNNYKNLKIILLSIIIAIIVAFGAVVAYLYHITGGADYGDSGGDYNHDAEIEEEEKLNLEAMGDVTDANSLNEFLYSWANNGGEKMHSKNVLNVLLCGIDTNDGTASAGRADSIILVSVNKKTKEIVLSSFFRDSYIYMDIPKQDGTTEGRYEKLNAAYRFGGPAALIDTIEKNFKVEIDQYIAVDFSSFTKLIDALGGVTVDVEQREAMYIRRTSSHKNFPYGNDVKLNGKQALVYSRIRKLDSDVNRTERQRKVIKSLIESAKTASNGQLVNAYKQTAKYIRTGYTQTEVISLIATAVSQNWMKYTMEEVTLPSEQGYDMASSYVNTTSMRNQWVWIVDYPICAQKLQKAIYGESNIILDSDRVSALDYTNVKKSYPSSNSGGSGSSGNNTTSRSTSHYSTKQSVGSSSTTPVYSSESTEPTSNEPTETSSSSHSFTLPSFSIPTKEEDNEVVDLD